MFYQKKLLVKQNGKVVRTNNVTIRKTKKGYMMRGKVNGRKVRRFFKDTQKKRNTFKLK